MAIQSDTNVLRFEVIESLQGADYILNKTVMDLTSVAKPGADRVTVPHLVGLALGNVPTNGSDAPATARDIEGYVLLLNQTKQVHDYIGFAEGKDSALDIETSFLSVAPKIYAEGIEQTIADALATSSLNDFNATGDNGDGFSIMDIALAKKALDKANVPKTDRYLAVNAEGMQILSSTQEFQDGAKSLSPEALREGVVSQVKGFKVIQSEQVADGSIHCYHMSAVAFALHSDMEYVTEDKHSQGRKFIALRGKYGTKDLDNASNQGVRKLTISYSV